jgi:hypothetical protein
MPDVVYVEEQFSDFGQWFSGTYGYVSDKTSYGWILQKNQ